ncbi:kita-kyushu lung cancer antigen 1 [Cervus canadensis]|uniref:kita-kyushu lung cancer antigen 1 n=1 Tax=Cervus canadensis TaxID=1574408 RepID=UPI001CA30AAB|nr:kita-kyushu lung cancer antigen 1 [Cervus canadensis]
MSLLFLLVSSILFAFMFVFWKTWFQRNTGEMSSNSTSLALREDDESQLPFYLFLIHHQKWSSTWEEINNKVKRREAQEK